MRAGARHIWRLAAVALVALVLPARAANIGSGVGLPQPMLLRIRAFIGEAPPGAPTLGPFTLGVGATVIRLDLTGVQTLNGPLTEGPAALQQFDLYNPNLLVVGESAVLRGLTEAPQHTHITLFGYVHAGARRMYVVQVERT